MVLKNNHVVTSFIILEVVNYIVTKYGSLLKKGFRMFIGLIIVNKRFKINSGNPRVFCKECKKTAVLALRYTKRI